MEGTHLLGCYSFLIILIISFLCTGHVESEVYTVGDEEEWNTGVNFLAWTQKYNFSVGDVLVFNYVREQHNTYEVTEDTYRSCDASTGVLKMYESGHDQVTLTEARNYWFICNVSGHCLGGMRFGVEVKEGGAKTNTSSAGAPNSGSEGTNGTHAQGRGRGRAWAYFFAFMILLILIC